MKAVGLFNFLSQKFYHAFLPGCDVKREPGRNVIIFIHHHFTEAQHFFLSCLMI
jgi:hypothetical protein